MYLAYLLTWRIIGVLPEKIAYGIGRIVSDYVFKKNGKGVRRLKSNYSRVVPNLSDVELNQLTKMGMRSYLRYWIDTFRLNTWSKDRIISTTTVVNEHLLRDPIKSKQGCLVVLPHAGNWDHAGAYFCAKGARVNTVAEHLKPERLFRRFLAHRERMGMRVLDLSAKVLDDLRKILREEKELVALVADRDLSRSGINVRFFDKTARMPAGPAILAYETEADLITAYVSYREKGIEVFFTPPIKVNRDADRTTEIARLTQVMASRFEDAIRKDPVSWHMQQRIFIDESFVERS